MGFFDFLKKKPEPAEQSRQDGTGESVVTEIAKVISNGDRLVMLDAKHYTADPAKYFAERKAEYGKYGVDSAADLGKIQWLGLAESLVEQLYAVEVDSQTACGDFAWNLNQLLRMEEYGIAARDQWMNSEAPVTEWFAAIDEKWAKAGCCLAGLDIGGKSYVVFPIRTASLERLKDMAQQAGQRIDRAKEL